MVKDNILIEDAKIGYLNFSGKEGQFNPVGRRNFCVFLEPELASVLQDDGWNIRWRDSIDEQEPPEGYLQVTVSYDHFPPKVVMITSRGKTILDEDSVSALDWAEIKTVDVLIRPYNWVLHEGTRNEKRGVKAYAKSLYVTIIEDELELKYADIPSGGGVFDGE